VCKEYLQAVSGLIPELIQDTYILPEPRPRKENQKIFLVRSLSSPLSQKFLWILSLQIGYLGGGSKESILRPKAQGLTLSVRTNRIYFQSRVIPVDTIFQEGEEIRGFDPCEIRARTEEKSELERNPELRIQPFSELFDDPDLTKQEERIRRIYQLNPQVWQPGSIYTPIGREYQSLSFRFLEADFVKIQSTWEEISPAFWLAATLSNDSLEKPVSEEIPLYTLHRYLSRFKAESSYSPSGNLRWRILLRNEN